MPDLLLIEDNAELRRVLTEAVEMDGFTVTIAHDAEEGLELLHTSYLPAVILCDVVMPHMSGLDFLRYIRTNPSWAEITFIAMSGTVVARQEALAAGANHYLVKPFNFQDLYEILAQN